MEPATKTIPNVLRSYVAAERARGVDTDGIRKELQASGWPSVLAELALQTDETDSIAAAVKASEASAEAAFSAGHPPRAGNVKKWLDQASLDRLLRNIFIIGFASIFLINGVIAWARPTDFINLLQTFPIAVKLGHIDLMVSFASFNDLVLGSLILSRKWQKPILAWAGVWLALVSVIKLVSLL